MSSSSAVWIEDYCFQLARRNSQSSLDTLLFASENGQMNVCLLDVSSLCDLVSNRTRLCLSRLTSTPFSLLYQICLISNRVI